ncbi:hypothetical protein PC114_g15919 [Phytophthora cactorum]|uniref:Uncharacterized protein n=1 Tax=Phytophthora cactorum TaxID=29920 RepID=A0A8T1BGN4_9STRA|nr:hypothetical protein PC114_g15919 [Phytophthora cactorum]KAG2901395.1 hypothetical protein PC115_g15874 [Phytophthora cactorum]KAG3179620.1 hypothetical protein PC128_g15858 [Phytophthora cactorum]
MAIPVLSAEMEDFLDLYEMNVRSPVFKTAALVDSWQDIDDLLLPALWPSLPSPVVQDADAENMKRSNKKSTSSLRWKKWRRKETERKRQHRYRERLRVERETLGNEVEILFRELEKLKEDITQKQIWSSVIVSPIKSCWLSATTSEKEKLLHSERERQRLEAAVNMQAAYIEHLRELVPDDSLDTEVGQSKSQASLTCGPTRSESEQAAAKAKRELGSEAYASTRERSLQILRGGAQATAELPTRATVRDTNEENEPHVDGVVHSVYGATDELDVELIRVDQPSSDTRSYWVKATLYYTRSTVTNGGKQRRALPGYSPRSRLTYRIWRAI